MRSARGESAASVARRILDDHGLGYVQIDHIGGNLTDNFDPRTNVVHLSDTVYGSASIAAIGVAAHECGHAVLFAEEDGPLKIRNAIIPITNSLQPCIPVFFLGLLMNFRLLMSVGVISLFAGSRISADHTAVNSMPAARRLPPLGARYSFRR